MKNIKLPLFVLIAVLLVLVLTADKYDIIINNPSSKVRPKIIYVYKTTLGEIEFWRSMSDGIKSGAMEFDMDYSIIGAREESDIEGNIHAVDRAIALKPDAIVLAAADYNLLEPTARKVVEAGILLLTIDSDVAGGVSRCFIGTDNYQAGRRMGEEILKRTPSGSKIGVISHVQNSQTSMERIRGISDALSENSVMLSPVFCDNYVLKAREQALAILDEHPDIAGFVATNERSAIGLAEGISERGLKDEIAVVTCDHASRQITYLEQGVIDATIVQKPFNMGYFSVQIANALLKNDTNIPNFFDTDSNIITIDNYFTYENQKLLFPF